MINHIKNLKELKRLTCLDCYEKKQGTACCLSELDNFRRCDYIKSLNFAVEILEHIEKERNK